MHGSPQKSWRRVAGTAGYVAERFVEAHSKDGRVGRRRRQWRRRREQSAQGDAHLEARRVCVGGKGEAVPLKACRRRGGEPREILNVNVAP